MLMYLKITVQVPEALEMRTIRCSLFLFYLLGSVTTHNESLYGCNIMFF
jgi:hypothetical protein